MEVIAIVKLAPGEVGYYDEITGIHLTIAKPEQAIYAGTNTKNLKRSVRSGRLKLVSGTLSPEVKGPAKLASKTTPQNKKIDEINKVHFEEGAGEITINSLSKNEINDLYAQEDKPKESEVKEKNSTGKKGRKKKKTE